MPSMDPNFQWETYLAWLTGTSWCQLGPESQTDGTVESKGGRGPECSVFRDRQQCDAPHRQADFYVAGFPCTPFSTLHEECSATRPQRASDVQSRLEHRRPRASRLAFLRTSWAFSALLHRDWGALRSTLQARFNRSVFPGKWGGTVKSFFEKETRRIRRWHVNKT